MPIAFPIHLRDTTRINAFFDSGKVITELQIAVAKMNHKKLARCIDFDTLGGAAS